MATTTKDEITTLEYSTLKVSLSHNSQHCRLATHTHAHSHTHTHTHTQVPYELLNKKFRSVQKILDREITLTTSDCSTTLLSQPTATGEEVDTLLSGVSGRLVSLKRKADEAVREEIECVQACKTRLEHLKAYASGVLAGGG